MATKINKLPLKDILAAIDMNAKNVWEDLSDDEKKQVSFYLLNRYASAIKGSTQDKQLQILKKNIRYHEWIGYKFKESSGSAKTTKFLEKLYPTMKPDEIKLLVAINDAKEIKQLAKDFGMTPEQIKKQL